jgi:uncharacterized protein
MNSFPTSSRARWAIAAATAVMALSAGCSSLEARQRQIIFSPSAGSSAWGAAQTKDMQHEWIEHHSAESQADVKLHALWHPSENAKAPVMLYLHGARRTVEASAFRIRRMRDLGFSVLAVDYRGFGQSTNELPSEAAVVEDARAAWDWLARKYPQQPRYIFGHSLGGAIAVQLACGVDDASGLIVEGTFTSIPDVFRSFKWGWLPVTGLITQRFDSAEQIARVKVPVLVVHGSNDTLIPPELGRALYERASSPKKFVLVDGGTHYSTNSEGQLQYRQALNELFDLKF